MTFIESGKQALNGLNHSSHAGRIQLNHSNEAGMVQSEDLSSSSGFDFEASQSGALEGATDLFQPFSDWMGKSEHPSRRWISRLPAMIVAVVILVMFVLTTDPSLILALGLLVAALGLQTGVK